MIGGSLARSLAVQLHDVVVGDATDRALVAPASALDARSDVATGDEGCIALVLVAELAHLGLLTAAGYCARGNTRRLLLGSTTDHDICLIHGLLLLLRRYTHVLLVLVAAPSDVHPTVMMML